MSIGILIAKGIAILVLAPLIGGLLAGADRIISARMQGRQGPPLLQPFFDVIKLFQKETTLANATARLFIVLTLIFSVLTVLLFGLGADLLLCIFAFTLACVFFVIAGYSSYSPYSFVGTERELVQIMCYEPMILIMAFGYYKVVGSFDTYAVFSLESPIILKLPIIFVGLLYVLTIKLRKSPFDLSMSHHGHQEIVKGITTELTGSCLAMVEIIHWFETVFALGLVYLFFAYNTLASQILALAVCVFVYFLEIVIDNACARIKWKMAIAISWSVIFVTGSINLLLLNLF